MSFRGSEPALAVNALSGGIAVKDDTRVRREAGAADRRRRRCRSTAPCSTTLDQPVFNLQISSDKLSLPEIAQIVPALAGIRLQPSFNVKAGRAARSALASR